MFDYEHAHFAIDRKFGDYPGQSGGVEVRATAAGLWVWVPPHGWHVYAPSAGWRMDSGFAARDVSLAEALIERALAALPSWCFEARTATS